MHYGIWTSVQREREMYAFRRYSIMARRIEISPVSRVELYVQKIIVK